MSAGRVTVRQVTSAACEFCARRIEAGDPSPLCNRCLLEMSDPEFARQVNRALCAESRAALARIIRGSAAV